MKWLTVVMMISMILQLASVDVQAAAPDLVIEQVQLSTSIVGKATAFTATFIIRNTTAGKDFTNVYINLATTNFSIANQGSNYLAALSIPRNSQVTVSLPLICNETKSNQIPINIDYLENNVAQTTITTEQILVTLENTSTSTEKTDTTKFKPELLLTAGDVQTIEAGTTKQVSFTIKNNSGYDAKNVVISPTLAEDTVSKISLNQAAIIPISGELKSNTEQVLEFSLTANGITEVGTYPITYKVQFKNSHNDSFTTNLTGYIKVTQANNNSAIYISSQTISPTIPVRDQKLQIAVEVQNRFAQSISDVSVWIEGLSAESFLYQGQTSKKTFPVWSFETNKAIFDYLIDDKAATGNYSYKVCLSYTDSNGNTMRIENNYLIYLPSEDEKKGTLEISKMSVPSAGIAPETQFTVGFDVTNTGKKDLEYLEITLNNSTSIWAQSSSVVQIKKLAPAETKHVTYSLMAAKSKETMNLPVTFQIQYDALAGDGIEIKTLTQSLGVLVNGDKESTSKPKIVVGSMVTSPSEIVPGNQFELKLALRNTSNLKNIQNVKMTLTSVDPTTQATNIIPIGQSDSVFLGNILTQAEMPSTVALLIPSTYKGNVCDIKLSFTYEDSEGTAYDDQETIHLPIADSVELTVSDVRLGKVLDDGYSLELDFYNTGKGTLKNLMVDLDGEFDSTNSNYYVGDLISGRMDIYSVHINGLPTEKITGNILFTYEDGLGIAKELKVPVDLTYVPKEEINPEAEALEALSTNVKKPGFPFELLIVAVVIIAVVVIVIVRKKRKAV